jgi:UDP-N-acetylglucosamine transferase subunit ALG13
MKIFVTVGTQLPFDRLVREMDAWAVGNPVHPVFAQVGESAHSCLAMNAVRRLSRTRFVEAVESADVIVAHAGIGSVLTALDAGKRVILMPRRADLGEHRNDHQAATAAELSRLGTVTVVGDAEGLAAALDAAKAGNGSGEAAGRAVASEALLAAVAGFIERDEAPRRRSPIRPRTLKGAFGHG